MRKDVTINSKNEYEVRVMRIILNEDNRLEYKVKLSEDNIKWLKTIVSFSNTAGGKLIVGVDDETKSTVGIKGSRSELETRIADTIFNNIKPTPVISIAFKNTKEKDILIIRVSRGNETPYHLKSQGVINGTYVRFESTDRVATEAQIDELKMISKRMSFSNSVYNNHNRGQALNDGNLSEFINQINQKSENVSKKINFNKLLKWELVVERFDEFYATNGYMLLTSNPFSHAYIKLGLFEGKNKANLIINETFTG